MISRRFPTILFLSILIGLSSARAEDSSQSAADPKPKSGTDTEPAPERVDPGPFYGFWELEEPAGDTCVIIVKRGGRISCFWTGNASRAIQQGTWERSDETLTAQWETGHVDVFRKLGENAIERLSYEPGMALDSPPVLEVRGVRVSSRVPGSLTVPTDDDDRTAPASPPAANPRDDLPRAALPLRNAFLGFWKVPQSTGFLGIGGGHPHFYIQLDRNGDASVALRDWKAGSGNVGKWTIQDNQAIISWPGQRKDVLTQADDDSVTLEFYNRNRDLSDKPNFRRTAKRVEATEAGRYFQAGNTKRLAVTDIRGTWRPVKSTGNGEYIDIEGWGNAYRFPAVDGTGTDPGKWRLKSDRVVINWIDGSKDVIRMGTPDMILESYPPEVPLTGTPDRVIAVRRTNENPL